EQTPGQNRTYENPLDVFTTPRDRNNRSCENLGTPHPAVLSVVRLQSEIRKMRDALAVINTGLQPGGKRHPSTSRFNGFPRNYKPLKGFHSRSRDSTGLKPGVNERAGWKSFWVLLILLALSFASAVFAAPMQDAEYEGVAEEYVKTYLAAHPLQGTALGLHEFDGKISDYSRLALDAELSRLRRFEDRLAKFDPAKLGSRQSIDLRILQAAVKRGLFEMQDMSVFERNPMVYARAGDVNVYIKRN